MAILCFDATLFAHGSRCATGSAQLCLALQHAHKDKTKQNNKNDPPLHIARMFGLVAGFLVQLVLGLARHEQKKEKTTTLFCFKPSSYLHVFQFAVP